MFGSCYQFIQPASSPKKIWHMPLRPTDPLVKTFPDLLSFFLTVCLFISHLLFIRLLLPNLYSICLCAFPAPHPSMCHPCYLTPGPILCNLLPFLLHFLSTCPRLSPLQSNPFTLSSNSLGHPRALALFFHLSISFSSPSPLPSPSLSVLLTCST